MNLRTFKDYSSKIWYVDYIDEDGSATYGPDTYAGCTEFIQVQEGRVESGEKFEVEDGPYKKETKEYEEEDIPNLLHEVESAINADQIIDLYDLGNTTIKVPESVDASKFAEACIEELDDLLDESEINYSNEVDLAYNINSDGTVTIYVK